MSQALSTEEKSQILSLFEKSTPEQRTAFFESLSMMMRALDGQQIEQNSVVTRLTDVKNIRERSRYPTYRLVRKITYLNLLAHLNPNAQICKTWADLESETLIAYKGLQRKEWVEQTRAENNLNPQQTFNVNPQGQPQQEQKRGFFSRFRGQRGENEE